MIFGTNSNYMLKYQKAKAKLVEYDISQKDYPKFPLMLDLPDDHILGHLNVRQRI